MALFTTTPAREMMPIIVIIMTKSIWKITRPNRTPISEKNTLKPIIKGVVTLLNCDTIIKNIKNILKIKNQNYNSVKRDGDIILVNANDPVFASSAINLLFGIEKIAIARQTKNNFQNIILEITSIGGNLLLKGEKFLVKVEGISKGFLVKDIEIAATSNIIEKKNKQSLKHFTSINIGSFSDYLYL
jgi:hypothetical protein